MAAPLYPTFRRLGQAVRSRAAASLPGMGAVAVFGALALGCTKEPPRGQEPFVPADREAVRRETALLFAGQADAGAPGAGRSDAGVPMLEADAADAGADAGPPRPLPDSHPDPSLVLRRERFLALRDGLLALAKTSPPGYPHWESIAADGAEAARRGDVAGARASCIGCHERHAEHWRRDHPWPPPERPDAH